MWLINALTHTLQEFFDNAIPPYNIVSHTWDKDEITFQDMQCGTGRSKAGYRKIERTCRLSRQDRPGRTVCDWVWIDSCCIDKSSSAHLSEAINSMYQYYKGASTCFVYLADAKCEHEDVKARDLKNCRWFTRSWTLQELIAPRSVVFFDRNWRSLGTKNELRAPVVRITGIDAKVLQNPEDLPLFSIAQRMSWAAGRSATRSEDVAYSLFGIFDVNMPLLYGEGSKAFIRLQEAIMRQSDDQSLFAWGSPSWHTVKGNTNDARQQGWDTGVGFLACSPDDFANCRNVISYNTDNDRIWTMTNKGIQVRFPTIDHNVFLLNCYLGSEIGGRLAVPAVVSGEDPKVCRRAASGLKLYRLKDIDAVTQQRREHFWAIRCTNRPKQTDRSGGIYIDLHDQVTVESAQPSAQWDSAIWTFFRPRGTDSTWSVRLKLVDLMSDMRLDMLVFVVDSEAFIKLVDFDDYLDSVWAIAHDANEPLDWHKLPEHVSASLGSSSTASVALGPDLEACVKKRDVMGQEMFMVRFTSFLDNGDPFRKENLAASLVRRLG